MRREKRLQYEQIDFIGNSILFRSNHLKVKQDKGLFYFDICGNCICCEYSICVLNGGDGMKGNEVTQKDRITWDKEGYFPVACRLCGEVMLFPKKTYSKSNFKGWECGGALSAKCRKEMR